MEPETLRISVNDGVNTKEKSMGTPPKGQSTPFAEFLKENGYTADGRFIITANKDKNKAILWKKVAEYNGELTT